jgi:hypothetical protein
MAWRYFQKKSKTAGDFGHSPVGSDPPLANNAFVQNVLFAVLIAIGAGGFAAVGYASTPSASEGEGNSAQSPEPGSAASVPPDGDAPEQHPLAESPSAKEPPAPSDRAAESQGNVAELQRMLNAGDLAELRTTYNGSYGASLLLSKEGLTYYVALIQQKSFWRVIKTQNKENAEAIYADFARKSVQLADVEVRRAEIGAEMADTERMIALAQARAERLQADLDIAHQQQVLFASRQKALREETAKLDSQKRAAQEQLRESRYHARLLQREADQGLPRLFRCGVSHGHRKKACR